MHHIMSRMLSPTELWALGVEAAHYKEVTPARIVSYAGIDYSDTEVCNGFSVGIGLKYPHMEQSV